MGKDIDKLFRDQLANRSFGWKEDYWETVESVIIAAERRRRRRFLFFFGIGALVLLGGGLALWPHPGEILEKARPATQVIEEKTIADLPTKLSPNQAKKPLMEEKTDYIILSKKDEPQVNPPVEVRGLTISEQQSGVEESLERVSGPSPIPSKDFSVTRELRPAVHFPALTGAAIRPADRSLAWRGGVGVGGYLFPLPGVWAGGIIQGKITGKWGFAAGLQFRIQRIPAFELGRTEQREVRFGEDYVQFVSEARSVHQVQIPLGATYGLARKWQVEAGGIFSWRFAARGVIRELSYPKPWERTSSEQANFETQLGSYFQGEIPEFPVQERTTVLSRGWVNAGRERAGQIEPYAGVQFNAGKRVSLTTRIAYRTGKPWPEEGEGDGASPWTVSVGAYYWFR